MEQHFLGPADRRRPDADRRQREPLALERQLRRLPRLQDDVEGLVEDLARVVDRNAHDSVLRELVTATDADLDAPTSGVVEDRHPFREPQRMRECEVDDRGPDVDPRGP